jgi:hypothetical protein
MITRPVCLFCSSDYSVVFFVRWMGFVQWGNPGRIYSMWQFWQCQVNVKKPNTHVKCNWAGVFSFANSVRNSSSGEHVARCVPKIDDRGRTLCVFYLYGDAEGVVNVSFGVKRVRSVTIAVLNGKEAGNIASIPRAQLGKKFDRLRCLLLTVRKLCIQFWIL